MMSKQKFLVRAGIRASLVLTMALVVALVAVSYWDGESSNNPPAQGNGVTTVTEEFGPPAVQEGPAGQPHEEQVVRGRGPDEADSALTNAVDLVPFEVELPSYMPEGLQLRMVAANDNGGYGWMQVFYGLPPDGTHRQEASILWAPYDPRDAEPLQQNSYEGQFSAKGLEWDYYTVNWPYYDTIEARVVVDGEMMIAAWIRVIGLSHAEALTELKAIISSMGPVSERA